MVDFYFNGIFYLKPLLILGGITIWPAAAMAKCSDFISIALNIGTPKK
jgi:hypothetical protein